MTHPSPHLESRSHARRQTMAASSDPPSPPQPTQQQMAQTATAAVNPDIKRLVLVTDAWDPQINGVVRTLKTTAHYLRSMGVEVHLITPQGACGGVACVPRAVATSAAAESKEATMIPSPTRPQNPALTPPLAHETTPPRFQHGALPDIPVHQARGAPRGEGPPPHHRVGAARPACRHGGQPWLGRPKLRSGAGHPVHDGLPHPLPGVRAEAAAAPAARHLRSVEVHALLRWKWVDHS